MFEVFSLKRFSLLDEDSHVKDGSQVGVELVPDCVMADVDQGIRERHDAVVPPDDTALEHGVEGRLI